MMKLSKAVFFLSLLLAFHGNASLMYAGYPAPGGNDFSGSGISPGHVGGRTFDLFNFDDTAYDSLYYGVSPDFLPEMGENGAESMAFNAGASNLANGVLVWSNSFDVFNAITSTNQTVSGQFIFTFTDMMSNALSLVSATSLGLSAEQGGYLQVLDDYRVNLQFEINGTAALSWYDSFANAPGARLDTSVGTGFYFTEASSSAAIPEPSSLMLMLLACGYLLSRKRFAR